MLSLVSRSFGLGQKKSVEFTLWVVFFCFSSCAALIFQKILLPIISPESAGTGLLPNDAAYFHAVASGLADDIQEFGWDRWKIFPAQGASGNVAVLALVYVFFGNDPALIIPINSALHAMAGILVFKIVQVTANNERVGLYAGIISAALFVVFPSALNWYGQNHKDVYVIFGMLLILLSLIRSLKSEVLPRTLTVSFFLFLIGVVLVGIVRPYNFKPLLVLILGLLLIVSVIRLYKRAFWVNFSSILFLAFVAIVLMFGIELVGQAEHAQNGDTYARWTPSGLISPDVASSMMILPKAWKWENTSWLPQVIDGQLETVARTRAGLIEYGVAGNANSMMDVHETPQNMTEVMGYLPRALQLAVFAPFPNSWFDNFSITRLLASLEMLVLYLCLPGIFLLLRYNRSSPVWVAIYFSSFFLMIHGFTIANLGTLYRLRYAYLFILLSLGVLGWMTWIYKSGRIGRWINFVNAQTMNLPIVHELSSVQSASRSKTIGSSVIVMLLTLLTFLGFFARDIMMANTYGIGTDLDYFFIALMIPMFMVTILAMPLGSAFVPFYLELKEKFSDIEIARTVKGVASFASISLLAVCLIVYFFSPGIFRFFYGQELAENASLLSELSLVALPLLLLSGIMILGNSILNANGQTTFTSFAQLIVPIVAVLALILFGEAFGVIAVLYGMVLGQILNFVMVQIMLRNYKTSVIPEISVAKIQQGSALFGQYWPLVGTAFFIGVATPIATLLAMSLSEGAVSAFNLGSKVVLFVTGLLGAVVTTVILPYFSNLMAKNHLIDARRELSFFLLLATFITVPLSALIYLASGLVVDLMLSGGDFSAVAKDQVTRVMQYSVVQLPFFVCNALLLRFAISTKHVLSILVIAILGLLTNVAVSTMLMKHMGVAGIALGGSVSVLISTVLLALVLVRYWHITLLDLVVMLLNWMLFLTLVVALHFQSLPSVYVVAVAYFVLMAGYLRSLFDFRFLRLGSAS